MAVSQLSNFNGMCLSNVSIGSWGNLGGITYLQSTSFMIKRRDGTNELVIPQKTLACVFGKRVLGPILDKILETAKSVDRIVAKAFGLLPIAKADTVGQIGWFETDCPEGWAEYTNLKGRVAIGAGYYIGVAEDGRTEQKDFISGTSGGEIGHAAIESEMAFHSHSVSGRNYVGCCDGGAAQTYSRIETYPNSINKQTSSSGSGLPHNNMQPYFVLKPCIKTISESYVSQTDLDSVETNVNALESNMNTAESDIETLQSEVSSLQTDMNTVESDISTLQSDINKFKSDSCEITCSSSKKSNSKILAVIGIIMGIFGTVFGCMGMFGINLKCSYGSKNEEIASEMQRTKN